MTPEAEIKKEIKENLDALGIYYFCPVQMGYGKRTVDFLCCFYGKFVGIEAKSDRGKLTHGQCATLMEIREAGGIDILATCWDDVIKELSDNEIEIY
jgi:hypothetical protein